MKETIIVQFVWWLPLENKSFLNAIVNAIDLKSQKMKVQILFSVN